MIEYRQGNLFDTEAEALINPVNCVGVMGAGLARQFKLAYPKVFEEYKKACNENKIVLGKMHIVETGSLINPRYVVNFPTKNHWRSQSSINDIATGLSNLVQCVQHLYISSIAIPALGCGLGGLSWDDVRPLMVSSLSQIQNVQILIFEPK